MMIRVHHMIPIAPTVTIQANALMMRVMKY